MDQTTCSPNAKFYNLKLVGWTQAIQSIDTETNLGKFKYYECKSRKRSPR